MQYDTGLPFQIDGVPAQALAEYGRRSSTRINFARGRIYPAFQVNASAGAESTSPTESLRASRSTPRTSPTSST